jgi:alpha-aminoadipate carrier protein LysW
MVVSAGRRLTLSGNRHYNRRLPLTVPALADVARHAPLCQERRRGIMVICPECESDLDIEEDEVDEGEIVSCPECGTDFEVITTNPLELNKVADEEEEEAAEEKEEEDF